MSFDGSGPKVIPDLEQTFLADSGYTSPAVGDPVYISCNNAVSLCAGPNAAFVGFVQSVIPVDTFGNQFLTSMSSAIRVRCKNTSGGALSAGASCRFRQRRHHSLDTYYRCNSWRNNSNHTAADFYNYITGLAAIINALAYRRGVVVVGGANNAQVQIIFG